jgi:hypothetical protein
VCFSLLFFTIKRCIFLLIKSFGRINQSRNITIYYNKYIAYIIKAKQLWNHLFVDIILWTSIIKLILRPFTNEHGHLGSFTTNQYKTVIAEVLVPLIKYKRIDWQKHLKTTNKYSWLYVCLVSTWKFKFYWL